VSRVTVDGGRSLGKLDRNVFGGFVEHLGRCINGGLFEEGSPLSDSRGFRTDVLDLLRPLCLSVLRWPGGNFVSNYLWTDGIGPRDGRPQRLELAWGAVEPNRFGTDEFLQYCAELGAAPYICLNMGTGDSRRPWPGSSTATPLPAATGPTVVARTAMRLPTGCPTGASATRCTVIGRSVRCRRTNT